MPVDSRSPNRNYPIPNSANLISEDFPRLITALNAIDTDVHGLLSSVAARALLVHTHTIADVSGLQAALDGKQPVGTTYTLASLTDVNVAGVSTGQFLVRGATQWQPSTFNPATKADLAGASFTGGIAGTTAAFTGIVEGAAATSGGHLLNRTTADARYDRITTSPTALTNGATIPSTENGRFYSMSLPTVQTASLPSTSGLPDGFSCVVRVLGAPSAYQSAFMSGNSKLVLYRGNTLPEFMFIGFGEIFRFTWFSGMDLWVAECLVQPNVSGITGFVNSTNNAWNSSPTAWTPIHAYANSSSHNKNYQSNSNCIQVAAAGLYSILGMAQFSAGAGGGVSGVGYVAGGTNAGPDTSRGFSQHLFHVSNGDGATLSVHWTEALQPADLRTVWFLASDAGVYTYLSGNFIIVRLMGR